MLLFGLFQNKAGSAGKTSYKKSRGKREEFERRKGKRRATEKGPPRASQESVEKNLDGVLNDIEQMQRVQPIAREKIR